MLLCLANVRQELTTRYFAGTQGCEMAGILLAIDQRHTVFAAQGHQCRQRNFRGVCGAREHGLAKHGISQRHTIQPAFQLSIYPGFNAVGKSSVMQVYVGLHHGWHDPRAGLPEPGAD